MPLYEYQCLPHGHRFEARHGYNDEPVQTCEECGGPVRRIIQPVGIVFKGSGFYATDSRSSKSTASPPKAGGAESKGSGESPSETPAAKTNNSSVTGSGESKGSETASQKNTSD